MIFDRTSRDLNIVEWNGVIRELLIVFVSLAGDQNNVARLCQFNGAINGLSAVDNLFIVCRSKSFSISVMMVSGFSLRGLSEVMMA
jgi:hypothetical protein